MGSAPFGKTSSERVSRAVGQSPQQEVKVTIDTRKLAKGDPNPLKFKVIWAKQYGDYLLAKIHYPDCHNFEGNKIILFKGLNREALLKEKYLDPHFSITSNIIARFKPDFQGELLAKQIGFKLARGH
jgi:hypothetical protein